MKAFDRLYQRACERKGGEAALRALLSKPLSDEELAGLPDALWLEEFTRKVFQSGFVWSVIDKKWPGFREVFWQFDIDKLLMRSPEQWEQAAQDERIVRNFQKVQSIPHNCLMIHEIAEKEGSFSRFIANWPSSDIVGLWDYLKQHGARLGGNTGPYTLRMLGKDTFILSRDVETFLRANEVFSGGMQSKKSLRAIQEYFNRLQQESGLSLQELSKIMAYSVGDNIVGLAPA